MKSNPQNRFQSSLRLLAVICLGCAGISQSQGADKTWVDAAANNTWDTTATDTWADAIAWSNATPDSAIFGGTGETVTLGVPITANALTFNAAAGTYTITASTLTLGGSPSIITATTDATIDSALAGSAFTKAGAGKLTLNGGGGGAMTITTGTVTLGGNFTRSLALPPVVPDVSGSLKDGATVVIQGGVLAAPGGAIAGNVKIEAGSTLRNSAPHMFQTATARVWVNGGTMTSGTGFSYPEYYLPAGASAADPGVQMTGGTISGAEKRWNTGNSYFKVNAAETTATFTSYVNQYAVGGSTVNFEVIGGTVPDGGPDFLCTNNMGDAAWGGTVTYVKTGAGLMEMTGRPILAGNGTFTLTGGTLRLTGANAITNFGSATSTLALDSTNAVTFQLNAVNVGDSLVFSKDITGGASANARIEKIGDGSVSLTGAGSTFAGTAADAISVKGGKLYVNVALAGSPTTVSAGRIGGSGSIGAATIGDEGTIEGGSNGVGTLTTGNLTFGAVSSDTATVAGTLAAGVTPISVQNLTLNGGNGSVVLNASGSGLVNGSTYDVMSYTSISAPNAGSPLAAFTSANRMFAPVLDTVNKKVQLSYDANAVLTWTGTGSSEWSYATGLNNWKIGATTTDFRNGDFVTFGNVARTDVELADELTPGGVTFDNDASHNYTLTGYGGIMGGGSLTKKGLGKVTINTLNAYTGATVISAGTLQIGNEEYNGKLSPASVITNDGTLAIYNDGGDMVQGTDFSSAAINGGGSLVKAGANALTLNAANGYSGGTVVSQGGLKLNNVNAAGTGGAITLGDANTGDADITLTANVGSGIFTNPITVSASGTGMVTIAQPSNFSDLTGLLTLNRATTVSGSADRSAISGKITGNVGTLTFAGGRIAVQPSEANGNDFTGNVVVTGRVQINNAFGIPASASVTVANGGRFGMVNFSAVDPGTGQKTIHIDGLNGSGGVDAWTGGGNLAQILAIGSSNGGGNFSGTMSNAAGAVNGDVLSLAKSGTGTQILSGNNTYTGTTTVNGGALQIDGSKSGGGAVAVKSTATLAGSGNISGATTVEAGGFVAPGNYDTGIGTLTLASATLSGTYKCQLGATTGDSVMVTGALTANAGAEIQISSLAVPTAAVYVIATYGSLGGTPPAVSGIPVGYTVDFDTPGQIRLVSTAGGYNAWVLGFPGLTDTTPGGDPDADGISNLMEYVVGGDPRVSSTQFLPAQSIVGSNLVLTYKRSDTSEIDTTQTGQWSTNLTVWTDIAPVLVNENGTNPDDMMISIPLTNAVDGKLFGRLKVAKP